MERSVYGLAFEIPTGEFSAGPCIEALRAIATREKCSILGETLPDVARKGKVVPRNIHTWAFRRGENYTFFLIDAQYKHGEVDPTTLPVNQVSSIEELKSAADFRTNNRRSPRTAPRRSR